MNFNERALRRIWILTVLVALLGFAVVWLRQGARPSLGFLLGAGLSIFNFKGLSMLTHSISGASKPGPVAALLIALRYVLIGCALYVIVVVLGFAPTPVLAGLLASFGAVILEILYELIFQSHE